MYDSLKLPWSTTPPSAEIAYRDAGLVKTKGTIYLLPPSEAALRKTFNAPPRPKSRMSSGATALCKHFERGGASSERGIPHPFWTLPTGSNNNKSSIAAAILDNALMEAVWRNVMILHAGIAIYEIRNGLGYGMRWTLQIGHSEPKQTGIGIAEMQSQSGSVIRTGDVDSQQEQEGWRIMAISFRGFVEPIEGTAVDGNGK